LHINFKKHEDALEFIKKFNHYIFYDDKEFVETITVCDFAPFPWSCVQLVQPDPLQGTIYDDEKYCQFIEQYTMANARDCVAGVPINPDGDPLTPEEILKLKELREAIPGNKIKIY